MPESGNDRPRMKPLHWDKVTPANAGQSMVWDKITDGSIRFDDDLIESLFGYVPGRPSAAATTSRAAKPSPASPSPQIRLLDPRKSQNVAIIVRTLAVSRQDILDGLLDGHGLSRDTLEKLSRISPTPDEQSLILSFSGDPADLADADSFLYHILRAVPSAFPRAAALHFRCSVYDPEIHHLKDSLHTLELACKELRTRELFLKLLEATLKAGNRMNAGTARGNAQAFDLTALRKLSGVKSTDGKTNLLHFVVEEVVRSEGKRCAALNRSQSIRRRGSGGGGDQEVQRAEREREYTMLGLPVVGGLSVQLANVKKAAGIDLDVLASTCSVLGLRVAEIRVLAGSWEEEEGGFVREMAAFVESAVGEIEKMKEEQGRVMEKVRRTTEYYQPGGGSKDRSGQSLQLFVIVRDFLTMVDQACVDIARDLQKKRPATVENGSAARSGGAKMAEGLPAVENGAEDRLTGTDKMAADAPPSVREERISARFPKLPAKFMADNPALCSDTEEEEDEF